MKDLKPMVHTPTLTTDKHKTWTQVYNYFMLLNGGCKTDQYDKISSDQQPPDDSIAPVHIFPHGVLLLSLLTIYCVCHGEDNSALMLRCSLTDIQQTTAWRSTTVHSSTTTPLYRIQSLSEPHCMGKHINKTIKVRGKCYMKQCQYNAIK